MTQHAASSPRPVGAVDTVGVPAALGFVEVPSPSSWPLPALGMEIELQRADGARLRLHARESQLPLEALVRTVLETR
jgi:hypothetical protein